MVKVLSILNKLDNAIFVVQKILILIGVIAFILVLLFSLFNQVYSFGYSIYRELLYRS